MADGVNDRGFEEQILSRQTEIIYKPFSTLPFMGLIGGALVLLSLWGQVATEFAVIWYSLIFFAYGVLLPTIYIHYRKLPYERRYSRKARISAIVFIVVAGMAWGSAAYFMYVPDSSYYQIVLAIYIVGVTAIAAIKNFAYPPSVLYSQLTIIILPLIIHFFLEGTFFTVVTAISMTVFLLCLCYFHKIAYQSLKSTLNLQFQLKSQKDLAENSKRSQTKFLAAASHDLRQPLHSHGLLASLLKKYIHEPEGQMILDTMTSSMQSMRNLLNSLLDISKLDAGAMYPVLHPFDIQELLDQLFLDYESHARQEGANLSVRSMHAVVWSDRSFVERILRNLISNAITHSKNASILVAARYRHSGIRLEVRDSGPGIAPEYQEIIFQEYKQAPDKNNSNSQGLGLGLAIVYRLATLLNVKLDFTSKAGMGSTFAFELPLAASQPYPIKPDENPDSTTVFENREILVVDDNAAILTTMRYVLEDWKCNVTTCITSQEALSHLKTTGHIPDLIITDYRLQDTNGIDLLDNIYAILHMQIPAIIVTGDTAADKIDETQHSKHQVLFKPVEPDQLKATISRLLGNENPAH